MKLNSICELPRYFWIISSMSVLFVISTVLFTKWQEKRFMPLVKANDPVSQITSTGGMPLTPPIAPKTPDLDNDAEQSETKNLVYTGEGEYAGMTAKEILADVERKLEAFHVEHAQWKIRQADRFSRLEE